MESALAGRPVGSFVLHTTASHPDETVLAVVLPCVHAPRGAVMVARDGVAHYGPVHVAEPLLEPLVEFHRTHADPLPVLLRSDAQSAAAPRTRQVIVPRRVGDVELRCIRILFRNEPRRQWRAGAAGAARQGDSSHRIRSCVVYNSRLACQAFSFFLKFQTSKYIIIFKRRFLSSR